MKDFAKYKGVRKIYVIFCLVALIVFQITASANDNVTEYEIYNNGKFIGVSSIMRSYSNPDDKPVLYINIKDIYRLGLQVKDIENGISVSNSIKNADIFSNGEPLHLDGYTFNNALISSLAFNDYYLMLDVIV